MPLREEQISSLEQQLTTTVSKSSVDGLTVENRSIDEIIKALNYAKSIESQERTKRPFRINVFRAPGAVYGA
jgi:hypothetical protein